MYYLAEHRGLRAPVVKTVNETSMAERLGERYGVAVHEVPVGFKYVGPKMIETGAMMGGEESGGFGFGMHLPERDGIFADLMLLDLFLREREAGRWPVSQGDRPSPRDRRAVELPPPRRPRRSGGLSGAQGAAPGRAAAEGARRSWPAARSSGRRRSRPTTASSSSPTTARGCWSASAAPSRSCGSTRRPPRRPHVDANLAAGERHRPGLP